MKAKILWLWSVSAGQRKRIFLSCLIGLLNTGFSLGFIAASMRVIDVSTGAIGSMPKDFRIAAAITIILLIAQLLGGLLNTWLDNRMQVETENALRRRLFARLLHSRWNELKQFHTGDMVNRIEQDTQAITGLLVFTLPDAIVTGFQLIASFVFFYLLDHSLPWLLVLILPVFLLASRFYMKRMRRYTHDIRQSDSHIQATIQESLQHHTVIKTLEQNDRHIEKLDNLQSTLRQQVNYRTRFSLFSRSIIAFAFSGGYLIAFLWGAVRLSQGSMTFGVMTAFLQLVGKIQRPVLDLAKMIPTLITALTATDRLMELEALNIDESGEKKMFRQTPSVILNNLTFAYQPQQKAVFNDLSMEFPAGSHIAVMGETGKGKTTLIRLLLALIAPQQGTAYLTDGETREPISPLTRCNFVYVPQGNTLFSGTIRDNLLMGNPEASTSEMETALRIAVADFVFALPQGIDTLINEQGGGLSEGQAQRISIARALLRPGSILLLDEATSALDAETESQLLVNLKECCKGKTVIFITHHADLAEGCERVYGLK
ncbi:ABC transporter ATP-binding protein [Bacteroides sp. 224]|uniref:ABC transporter ATP-binding protein n=1 Tax=Bacteroides sp. 224 TaxID=2302936 RepID=UPI0013D25810|nr:ABC transporter ATP-binding protein [Bacteroides sp. 224]NDV67001.1 ABC transporter ATP-binding protein [Bacteroides sp. 224]